MERSKDSALQNGSGAGLQPTGNLFLDSLPECTRECLLPKMGAASFKRGELIYESDTRIERVLFPIGCVISVVTEMLDGATVEAGFIGREGMTGLPLALGSTKVLQRALVQVPDGALSMSATDFVDCLENEAGLGAHTNRYAHATIVALSQYAGCNRLHTLTERCARWLLMAHDRVPGDTIALTHEFLSQMLGVRRPGVTVAALTLQQAGFIDYSYGRIHVRNRAGLESATCECYAAVETQWKELTGYSARKPA